jgi:endonuclease/exonuclease/phosphatase family metal-dependent hydrolase
VRKLAVLLAVALGMCVGLMPFSSSAHSVLARRPAVRFPVLQMNLCLSGTADCFPRTGYPAIVDEAARQILDQDPRAVTLNEACSGDVTDLARRTGYHLRFSTVLVQGSPLPCVHPAGRGVFGLAVLTRDPIRGWHDQAFATQAGPEQRRWVCVTSARPVTVCTAHLGTRGSSRERRVNDGECAELEGVLARYGGLATTVFGGDLNRRQPCAPASMWATEDDAAHQLPGIQHIYGSGSLTPSTGDARPATYTDHDFFGTAAR